LTPVVATAYSMYFAIVEPLELIWVSIR